MDILAMVVQALQWIAVRSVVKHHACFGSRTALAVMILFSVAQASIFTICAFSPNMIYTGTDTASFEKIRAVFGLAGMVVSLGIIGLMWSMGPRTPGSRKIRFKRPK